MSVIEKSFGAKRSRFSGLRHFAIAPRKDRHISVEKAAIKILDVWDGHHIEIDMSSTPLKDGVQSVSRLRDNKTLAIHGRIGIDGEFYGWRYVSGNGLRFWTAAATATLGEIWNGRT